MRISVWHGYLLADTGSNVYTRQLAREWSRAGHDVTVFSQDPDPTPYDLGGAGDGQAGRGTASCPCLSFERLPRILASRACQDCSREGARPLGRGQRVGGPRRRRCRLPPRQPRPARRAGRGRRCRRAVRRQGARLGARVRDARQRGALRAGALEVLSGAQATLVGSQHIRDVVGGDLAGTRRRRSLRSHPGSTSSSWRPQRRDEALGALLAESRPRSAEPRESQNERLPDEGTRSGSPPSSPASRKDVALREADRKQGRPGASGGAPRARRPRRDRRVRRLSRRARGAGCRARRPLHRPARAPAPRPPSRVRRREAPCRRSSRRRSAWSRPSRRQRGARRSSPTTRASPRRGRGSRRRTRPHCAGSSASRTATPTRSASGWPGSSRSASTTAPRSVRPRARRPVERWSWGGVARRILATAD